MKEVIMIFYYLNHYIGYVFTIFCIGVEEIRKKS